MRHIQSRAQSKRVDSEGREREVCMYIRFPLGVAASDRHSLDTGGFAALALKTDFLGRTLVPYPLLVRIHHWRIIEYNKVVAKGQCM